MRWKSRPFFGVRLKGVHSPARRTSLQGRFLPAVGALLFDVCERTLILLFFFDFFKPVFQDDFFRFFVPSWWWKHTTSHIGCGSWSFLGDAFGILWVWVFCGSNSGNSQQKHVHKINAQWTMSPLKDLLISCLAMSCQIIFFEAKGAFGNPFPCDGTGIYGIFT